MKFRKKPVIIEAFQLTEALKDRAFHWARQYQPTVWASFNNENQPILVIPTVEGSKTCYLGDWIIKGVKGELYPCKPDIFEATYEIVDEEEGND